MEKQYSHEKKQKLADKISSIKRKKDMVKIFEIIYEDNQSITENNNGLFMFFHKLENKTYYKIEKYLETIRNQKQNNSETTSDINLDSSSSENDIDSVTRKEYVPYIKDEFPSQKGISPKLKFSNKEKNLIKRRRYDHSINSENNNDVVYCQFDVTVTDSDINSDQNST